MSLFDVIYFRISVIVGLCLMLIAIILSQLCPLTLSAPRVVTVLPPTLTWKGDTFNSCLYFCHRLATRHLCVPKGSYFDHIYVVIFFYTCTYVHRFIFFWRGKSDILFSMYNFEFLVGEINLREISMLPTL